MDSCRTYQQLFTLGQVRTSFFFGLLGIYHTYFVFAAMVTIWTLGVNLLLEWWINFFKEAGSTHSEGQQLIIPIRLYLETFLRSCLLIRVMAELIRTSMWLLRDVWGSGGAQPFQLYRATLAARPIALMRTGRCDAATLLSSDDSWRYTDCQSFYWDAAAQAFIIFTLDVLPMTWCFITFSFQSLTISACGAATCNAILFCVAWNVNDVVASLQAWGDMRQWSFFHRPRGRGEETSVMVQSLTQHPTNQITSQDCEDDARLPPTSVTPSANVQLPLVSSIEPSGEDGFRTNDDTEQVGMYDNPLNLCAVLCGCLTTWRGKLSKLIAYVVIMTIAVLRTVHRKSIVEGLAVGIIALVIGVVSWHQELRGMIMSHHLCARQARAFPRCIPARMMPCANGVWAFISHVQQLGDEHFGFSAVALTPQYGMLLGELLFQTVFFYYIQWVHGAFWATVAAGLTVLRWISISCIRPWGGIVGVCEGLSYVVLAIVLSSTRGSYSKNTTIVVVLLSLLSQLTFSRHDTYMFRTLVVTRSCLRVLLLVIICVSMYAVNEVQTKAPDALAYTDAILEGAIPQETSENLLDPYPFCSLVFPLGKPGKPSGNIDKGLSVLDFALFSSLTGFETDSDVRQHLGSWFPGWTLVKRHRPERPNGIGRDDFTTFIEVEDAADETTIFAIRGTHSPVDLLQAINIWAPVAITQLAGFFGPALQGAVLEAVLLFSTAFPNVDKYNYESLFDLVHDRVAANPGRRYYLTGHSLGGGLAKLLSLEVGHVAVTFAAPGVGHTSMTMLSNKAMARQYSVSAAGRHLLYDVIPDKDIIPQLDTHLGTQLAVSCDLGVYECHKLDNIVAELTRGCYEHNAACALWHSWTIPQSGPSAKLNETKD